MTDKIAGYVVTLENNIREDDAETILNAIRMVRGVLCVTAQKDDVIGQILAERVRRQVIDKLLELLK